ncbi:methyl-accepting chemotaxis protein [Atopomonas sediminilitoris]|uniref:methyl-accepting chemotaxis protein n=1 Tax=Atopomonas sediminilitoris TaxID=2919919 RepID=UPI001F4E1648|nr:methyl-accepting chemotaxis protein [Atopomonas sediminilitoris]MCJ8167702.1 methyl-accepting chemotaxis protein [Atopomonas sediminilitoris]
MKLLMPGIRLFERFHFARKFQLLFLMFLAPMLYALWQISDRVLDELNSIDGELSGIELTNQLTPLHAQAALQRGTVNLWKAGNDAMQNSAKNSEAAWTEAANKLEALIEQNSLLDNSTSEQWQALEASRQQLLTNNLAQTPGPEAQEQFSVWVEQLGDLRNSLTNDTRLNLDPWLDTSLILDIVVNQLPNTYEGLTQIRDQGATIAQNGHFSLKQRVEFNSLLRDFARARLELDKTIDSLLKHYPITSEQLKQPIEQMRAELDAFIALTDKRLVDTLDISGPDYLQKGSLSAAQLEHFSARMSERFIERIGHYRNRAVATLTTSLGIFLGLGLLALYSLICLNSSIRRSTLRITEATEAISRGDLTQRLSVHGHDELASIAASLKSAQQQLKETLLTVNQEADRLSSTVVTLSQQSDTALQQVEAQQQQVSQIAAASHQLAATAQNVAQNCELAAHEAMQTKDAAEQGSSDSAKTTQSMQELGERLTQSASKLQQLREQAQQIDQVVDVIKGIAEQTNLLALNAAIEAARAGEQGRGFAVVADEVRSLSQRTQESTQEIGQTIAALQSIVSDASQVMEQACKQAEKDVQSVTHMGGSLHEIAEAVLRMTDKINQIAAAAEQQAATADEVSGNIQQVDTAAGLLLQGAQAVSEASGQLQQGSQTLQNNTARFRLQ